jgi:crotonobetainyl-CoA:carnitine CoA-transferase CaiB-like acyl-CoA transferase
MLSTCNLGQTGPYATQPGFGSQLSSLSGFTHLIGEAGGPPNFLYGPYIDFVAVIFGGAAVLAALDRQRRTGEGAFIDLSQYESGLQFIGGGLLNFSANGAVAMRDGNRDSEAVPHGCFRAHDGKWLVLSCWSDDEWKRLASALDCHGWVNERFATAADRRRHESEVNELIAARVSAGDAAPLMERLQSAGVHAAVVAGIADLFSDPQLAWRGAWQPHEHPEIGRHHYRLPAYRLSETPGSVRRPAPCLGEHNQDIFREWLGLTETEFAQAEQAAAFS